MCDTRTFVRLIQAAQQAGTKVIPLGDDRQVPSVDAGWVVTLFIRRLGAVELTGNHRFTDERQRQAAERLRATDPEEVEVAVEQYDQLGLLHKFDRVSQAHQVMVDDWVDLTESGDTAKMVADANRTVDDLNVLTRKALIGRGQVAARPKLHRRQTGRRIMLAEGDRLRLGRNDARLPQPHTDPIVVRNGMEATVTRHPSQPRNHSRRRARGEHRRTAGAAASYVAADVDYGYAVTCDKAQGVTVDHVLYHPTDRSCAERAYVALSRGRHSNRIYAVNGAAWQEALAGSRAHTMAAAQQPGRSDRIGRAKRDAGRRDQGRKVARRVRSEREPEPTPDCATGRDEPGRSIAMQREGEETRWIRGSDVGRAGA